MPMPLKLVADKPASEREIVCHERIGGLLKHRWRHGLSRAVPPAMVSFLQIHPHEAGHFFAHELRASVVDLVVLLRRFGASLLVGVRVKSLERRLEVLLPIRVLLLEFYLRDAF